MKMKMRPRWYCDHCGKASGSASAMKRHEPACTMNPGRTCRMCALLGLGSGRLVEGKAAFLDPVHDGDWKARLVRLREAVENCPCCILAVVRQTGATTMSPEEDNESRLWQSDVTGAHCLLGFDFQAELAATLKEYDFHNTEAA